MSRIKQKTIVGRGGIEFLSAELPEDVTGEVIVFLEPSEEDTIDYLLTIEANRGHVLEAIENVETRETSWS